MSRLLLVILVACLAACASRGATSAADDLACREEVAKKFPDTAGATGSLYERREARAEKAYDDCLRAREKEEAATEQSAAAAAASAMSCADPSCMTDEERLRRTIVACDAIGVNRPGSNQAALAQCMQHRIEAAKQHGLAR